MQHFGDLDPATEEQLRLNNFEVHRIFYTTCRLADDRC
jgi:hypothetical protein